MNWIQLLALSLSPFVIGACGKATPPATPHPPVAEISPPHISPQPSETPPPVIVDVVADGWEEITMVANSAKTTIDSVAHFNTSRNACGKDAYGAVTSLEDWNKLVKYANLAVHTPPKTEDTCTPASQDVDENGFYKKKMDGTVEIKLSNGNKRMLFEQRGSDICTNIDDPLVASALLTLLDKMVLNADREDCPNGWGSALNVHSWMIH